MATINLTPPSFQGVDLNDERQVRKLYAYLYKLDEQLRYVLSNLGEENLSDSLRSVINTNVEAEILNEVDGRLQRVSTQIRQTAEEIELKASKEYVDESTGAVQERLESQITQTAGEISTKVTAVERLAVNAAATADDAAVEIDDLTENVRTMESSFTQTAGEISTRVTAVEGDVRDFYDDLGAANEKLDDLDGRVSKAETSITQTATKIELAAKLDKTAPAVGVNAADQTIQSSVTITADEVDITTPKFEVNIAADDGVENALRITKESATFGKMFAGNVAAQYDGPAVIYVDPNEAAAYPENESFFGSLQGALSSLSGKTIPAAGVQVLLTPGGTYYGDAQLVGSVLAGKVRIAVRETDERAVLVGEVQIINCVGTVDIEDLDVIPGSDKNGITVSGMSAAANISGCRFTGAGAGSAILLNNGARAYITGCSMLNFAVSVYANRLARAIAVDNHGNCSLAAVGADILAHGTVPSASSAEFQYVEMMGGRVYTQGAEHVTVSGGGSAAARPNVTTVRLLMTGADSWSQNNGWRLGGHNDVMQGWTSGGGIIRGCVWFSNSYIQGNLAGKQIVSASLRLTMHKGVGRGVAVTVCLGGTAVGYSGHTADVLTMDKAYGEIGTIQPGDTTYISIPAQAVSDLADGVIQGLVIYSTDTGSYKERVYSKNYARFDGETSGTDTTNGIDGTRPILMVTYNS